MARSVRKKGKGSPWLSLLPAAFFSQTLYVVMARVSARPLGESWGARYTSPRYFEETLVFLALWLGLLVFYAVAVRAVRGGASRTATLFIFLTAASFRAALLPAPGFSKASESEIVTPIDRVTVGLAHGIAESRLSKRLPLLDEEGSASRVLATLSDLGALALLPGLLKSAGLPPALALSYGWNPLAVKETAGSGRLYAVSLLLLALSLRAILAKRRFAAAVLYGTSLAGSVLLLACLPVFTRALRLAALLSLGVAAVLWAAFHLRLPSELPVAFGGSLYPAAAALCSVFLTRNRLYPLVALLALWAIFVTVRATRSGLKVSALPRESLVALGSWLMVSPAVTPWSFQLVAFLAAFSPNGGWLVFTATAPLAYMSLGGRESFWLSFPQYFPAYAALIFSGLRGEPTHQKREGRKSEN